MNAGSTPGTLESNLSALQTLVGPESLQRLRAARPARELEIIPTRSGYPSARAFGLWVYSRHDPKAEALRLVAREIPQSTEICVFESLGLAYHIEAFLEALPLARAVIVEPSIEWFRTALEARDLTPILSSNRVVLLVDAEPELLPSILGDTANVHVVRLRALSKKNSDYFGRLSGTMRDLLSRREINRNTLARFGKRWVRNLIRNIELIPQAGDVQELAGSFASLPCIVLAAGPSLDIILPHLRELRERFLLLSVDTSYRAAIAHGVTPDFLAIVDPQYWNVRHLDGCPLDSTILLSESSTYPAVFHRPVDTMFFCGSLFPLGQFLEAKTGARGKLGAGGSVSTTTWDFARLLGCTPIICAGLDLGYPGLKTHFHGGFFEERVHTTSGRLLPAESGAFRLLRDAAPYPIENNSGGHTLTDKRLVIYKWWFENQLKIHPEALTLNLSTQGVRIEGMQPVDLEALLDYPLIRGEIDRRIASIRAPRRGVEPSPPHLQAAVDELIGLLDELRLSALSGSDSVDRLQRLLARGEDPAAELARLDEIDSAVSKKGIHEIAGFLMHSTAQEILERSALGDEGRREQVIADSHLLYDELGGAASYHLALLREAAERLRASRRESKGPERSG